MSKIIKKERTIEHPLEEIFQLEPGTTVVEYKEVVPTEILQAPEYDDKDSEIEAQFQEIYDVAMGNVTAMSDEIERIEGKYKARAGEVTATMLSVALSAAREKAQLKSHKDKMSTEKITAGRPGTVNNNLIVADRNEILRAFLDKKQ